MNTQCTFATIMVVDVLVNSIRFLTNCTVMDAQTEPKIHKNTYMYN